jgi:hypothetical protein
MYGSFALPKFWENDFRKKFCLGCSMQLCNIYKSMYMYIFGTCHKASTRKKNEKTKPTCDAVFAEVDFLWDYFQWPRSSTSVGTLCWKHWSSILNAEPPIIIFRFLTVYGWHYILRVSRRGLHIYNIIITQDTSEHLYVFCHVGAVQYGPMGKRTCDTAISF